MKLFSQSILSMAVRWFITLAVCINFNVSAYAGGRADITIDHINGQQVHFDELVEGKVTYLKLWASWCQDCLKQMSHMEETYRKYEDKLQVIGVNVWINESLSSIKEVIKTHKVTFPMYIDKSGELAQAFNLVGTPLHILIDSGGNIVHKGHEVNDELEQKILFLTTGQAISLTNTLEAEQGLDTLEDTITRSIKDNDKTLLLFTSTWCDWYLESSRPVMSENCTHAQKSYNALVQDNMNLNKHIIVNRLWTGENELNKYKNKYQINTLIDIDKSNRLFMKYKIKNMPMFVIFENKKEVFRTNDMTELGTIKQWLAY